MDMISLGGLRTAVATGGLKTVGVTASGGLFFVTVQPRNGGWAVLVTARGKQARRFRDAGKAIALLHEVGVSRIMVDVSTWEPARAAETAWLRPDVAARQKRLFGAAAALAKMRGEETV